MNDARNCGVDRTFAVLHNWHVVGCGCAMSVHMCAPLCVCVYYECVCVCVLSTKVPSAELPDILTIVVVAAETQPTASVPPNQEYFTLRHVDFDVLAVYVHSYGRGEGGQGSSE